MFVLPGNDSSVDGLVNFEKLRMIAKEIRHVVRMTSANMDPALMFRQRLVVQLLQIQIQIHFFFFFIEVNPSLRLKFKASSYVVLTVRYFCNTILKLALF